MGGERSSTTRMRLAGKKDIPTLHGRPQKRYTLTPSGEEYLTNYSMELAARFEDEEAAEDVVTKYEEMVAPFHLPAR
jgi:hypothetical protein